MKFKLIFVLPAVTFLASLLLGTAHAAGSASLSLSPSSGSYVQNSNFSLQVYENGTDVNVVTAKLSYDASKLSCTTVGDSSAFPSTVTATCGGGSITISRYSTTNVNGVASVGSISFTALAGSGTAAVNFISGSQIASNGVNIWDNNTTGATYSFTTPVADQPTPPSQPTQTQSSSTASTRSTNNSSTTNKSSQATATPTPVSASTAAQVTAATTASASKATVAAPKTIATTNSKANISNKPASSVSLWSGLVVVLLAVAAGTYWIRFRKVPRRKH